MLRRLETGLHRTARVADAANSALRIGRTLWQVGSAVAPLAAMLL